MEPIIESIYTEDEAAALFSHLDALECEYHKPYLRFNRPVKVPRGQASFTLDESIHYRYKAAGGSPPNCVMDETLRGITERVNQRLGTSFNTGPAVHCNNEEHRLAHDPLVVSGGAGCRGGPLRAGTRIGTYRGAGPDASQV